MAQRGIICRAAAFATLITMAATLLTMAAQPASALDGVPAPKESPGLAQAVAAGPVNVIVGLRIPWSLEPTLTSDALQAQQHLIATTQQAVAATLDGTGSTVTRGYAHLRSLAATITE